MELPYWEVIGILISLVFSAIFSGAETALTSLSEVRTQRLIEKQGTWAKALLLWKNQPNRVLATILIGNNISNITASVLASEITALYFPQNVVPISVGVMTFLLLFVGEITPKSLARSYSEHLAVLLIPVIYLFYILFLPVTKVLTAFSRSLIHLFGGVADKRHMVSEEDLTSILRLGMVSGVFDKERGDLLSSVFEFRDTVAREIMVPRTEMVAISLSSDFDQVMKLVRESGFSRIPVFEGDRDHVVGIFYTKGLITNPPSPAEKEGFLAKRMRPPAFVPESKKISEILKLCQEEQIHMAIVVNEFGGTEGLVTLEDVVEELLGEIRDEFDWDEEERVTPSPEGGFLADARVEIEQIEELLDISFPEEREYESLGGFLMALAGDVPQPGWACAYAGYTFHVNTADKTKVISVKIDKASPQALEEKNNHKAKN